MNFLIKFLPNRFVDTIKIQKSQPKSNVETYMTFSHYQQVKRNAGDIRRTPFVICIYLPTEGRDLTTDVVSEANRAFIVSSGPIRPIIDFPKSTIGSRDYKFQSRWYDEFEWLEYSL